MKNICSIFLIGLCLWVPTLAFMNDASLTKNIIRQWDCYRKNERFEELINGQSLPIPNTVESFVSIVERIEERFPTWSQADILKRILINFRYDDAVYNSNSFKFLSREGYVSTIYEIMNSLIDYNTVDYNLRDGDVITREERCALYYMISHTVNETARPGEETIGSGSKVYLKNPREQGLVTHGFQARGSFALGKVLLGVLAGLSGTEDYDGLVVYKRFKPGSNDDAPFQDLKINTLYAATFADIFSLTKRRVNSPDELLFLANGRWNEAVCPTTYILDANRNAPDGTYTATYSLVRGAIDGYVLGSKIKEINAKYPNLRISQLLRSYYSGQPLKDFEMYTWCNRHSLYGEGNLKTELKDKAIAYDRLFTQLSGSASEDVDSITKEINMVFTSMDDRTNEILDIPSRDAECASMASASLKTCDTPADIIALLDFKTTPEYRWKQSEIVGNVTTGFRIGRLASSAALFSNMKGYSGSLNIDVVYNNETNFTSGCAGCAAKYYEPLRSNAVSDVDVVKDLNRTLANMEEGTSELSAMNAKVVLYFNYGNTNDDYQLRDALWDFRRTHSLTRILAFGTRKETLDPYVRNRERDLFVNFDINKLKDLNERICKVPAQFQYKNCYQRNDGYEASARFDGFITPSKYQYWAMDPKHFLKSFKIELTFKAVTGSIRVCFSRDYSNIFDFKDTRGDCKELPQNEEKTYYVENPCKRRTEETCDPFYFYIEGKTINDPCTDKKCKTPNDIQYEFTHKGISCNSATALTGMTSAILLLSAVITWIRQL